MTTAPPIPPYEWLDNDGEDVLMVRGATPEEIRANIAGAFDEPAYEDESPDPYATFVPTWLVTIPCDDEDCCPGPYHYQRATGSDDERMFLGTFIGLAWHI